MFWSIPPPLAELRAIKVICSDHDISDLVRNAATVRVGFPCSKVTGIRYLAPSKVASYVTGFLPGTVSMLHYSWPAMSQFPVATVSLQLRRREVPLRPCLSCPAMS